MTTQPDPIDLWYDFQRRQGFATRTIDRRRTAVKAFTAWLAPKPWQTATSLDIEDWMGDYPNPATRRAYLSDVASLYRWAVRRDLVNVDPTADVVKPREPRRLPRPIPEAEAANAIGQATDPRVKLALSLACMAGLRRAEIAALDRSDLQLEGSVPTLTVRAGKGGRDRTVPIHPSLLAALGALAPGSGPVVGRGDGRRMTAGYLGTLINQHMTALGHQHRLHAGRHRFGTVAASASGGDLVAVAGLMGHSNPSTTLGYTQLSGARTVDVIAAMPPPAA